MTSNLDNLWLSMVICQILQESEEVYRRSDLPWHWRYSGLSCNPSITLEFIERNHDIKVNMVLVAIPILTNW